MAGEQRAESCHGPESSSKSGSTAINCPTTFVDVQPVQKRLQQNVAECQDSRKSELLSEQAPGVKARKPLIWKPLILQPRLDNRSRISKSNRRSTKVVRDPRRRGKDNLPPCASSAGGGGSIDRLDEDLLTQLSREPTAKLREPAAPATIERTAAQKAQPRREYAMTRQERALAREATRPRVVFNSTE